MAKRKGIPGVLDKIRNALKNSSVTLSAKDEEELSKALEEGVEHDNEPGEHGNSIAIHNHSGLAPRRCP